MLYSSGGELPAECPRSARWSVPPVPRRDSGTKEHALTPDRSRGQLNVPLVDVRRPMAERRRRAAPGADHPTAACRFRKLDLLDSQARLGACVAMRRLYEAVGRCTCPKYISLAGMIWPSTQCGQATDTFKFRNFANVRASVSIEVLTSCEVCGHRYARTLISLSPTPYGSTK
jgi:hypothetical protein